MRNRKRLLIVISVGLVTIVAALATVAVRSFWKPSPSTQFKLAWEAFGKGDLQFVRVTCDASQFPSHRAHVLVLEGALRLRAGRYEESLRFLRRTPPSGEWHWPALFLTGECLFHLQRYPEAEKVFLTMTTERPTDADAHRWLGAAYFAMGFPQAAIAAFKTTIECNPNDFRPMRILGDIQAEFGRYEEAMTYYQQALKVIPAESAVRCDVSVELANLLLRLLRPKEAAELLRSIRTPSPDALTVLAECEWSLGNHGEAERLLTQVLKEPNRTHHASMLLAKIKTESGEFAVAATLLKEVMKNAPNDSQVHYLLATVYEKMGEREKAAQEMGRHQESLALNEKFRQSQNQLLNDPMNEEAREELARLADLLGRQDTTKFWRRAASAANARRNLLQSPNSDVSQ